MKPLSFLFVLMLCTSLSAQNINGIVYNETSFVEGIKIENLTNSNIVFTDKNGEFSISAKVNDTLKVNSIFYFQQQIIVKPIYKKEPFVIQLKKLKNTLDEVVIKSNEKEKVADVKNIEATLKNQIQEDIKNNPHLYGKMPEGSLDIFKIIGLAIKLFKKKNKNEPFTPILYQDLISLFKDSNPLFNDALLTETLKIKKNEKFLFFEFIEAKKIDSQLLKNNKDLKLLELILKAGEEFSSIIENYKKTKLNKKL